MQTVTDLIPQRPPVVAIGALQSANENATVTTLRIAAESIFTVGNTFSEAGIIENIAQTAALHAGYNRKPGEPVKTGFIGAIKNLQIHSLPQVGDEIITQINIVHQVFAATIISGKVSCRGQVLAECEMKIFLVENEKEQ